MGLKKLAYAAGIVGTGSLVGGAMAADSALYGLKRSAAVEGAIEGAAIGTALVLTPKLGKIAGRAAARSARAKVQHGKVMFRRIRGRIVPIKPSTKTV